MTTKELLEADFRNDAQRRAVQKALLKMKPFSKLCGEVPLEKLEKFVFLSQRKYLVYMGSIFVSVANDMPVYQVYFRNDKSMKEMGFVCGCSLYELMAKACIKIWSMIAKNEIEKR